LADAAIRFAGTGVELPLTALAGEHRIERDRLALDARRRKLVTDIDKLRQLRARFNFDTGLALYSALFAPDGLLTVIDNVCRGEASGDDLGDHLPTDVRAHLDKRIAAANMPPMSWYKQGSYLRSIEDIVRSARVVASERTVAARLLVDHGMHTACVEFGRQLATTWDRLFVEAKSVASPYDQPLLGLLERLNPLLLWVRGRS
jgi:hypothetical protein